MIDLNELISSLKDYVEALKIEDYNEFTREWSKGYIKGFTDAVKLIELFKEHDE